LLRHAGVAGLLRIREGVATHRGVDAVGFRLTVKRSLRPFRWRNLPGCWLIRMTRRAIESHMLGLVDRLPFHHALSCLHELVSREFFMHFPELRGHVAHVLWLGCAFVTEELPVVVIEIL
jgi:hypothetical protein